MSDSKTAIIAAMAAMIMMVSAVAVFAVSDDASADETEKEYSIYIDLGGTVSAYFLGVEEDYGEASWETVQATNAKDALIAACEQKFGEGSITFNDWGGIDTINGMSGSGGSLKSEQSTGWDDVYFYPVQFVKEDGVWGQASVTIPNYTGESTTFALTFQPITFDEVVHTFADEGDQAVYEALMDVYGWPGWGTFSEPFVSLAGVAFAEESATVILEETYTPAIDFSPEDATNKNGSWISSDESVATVDENGVITAVGLGTATITFTTDYGFYTDSIVITVPEPKEYSIYIDLGGKMTSWIVDYYDIESEDDLVDYGGPSWETVSAYSVKEALTLACEQKFGAGSIEFTTSGGIKTINGIDGNGTYLFPDQAMSSENEHWIFYYPIQFVQTDDGWSDMQVYIGAYDGDATTFAVVCQPASFEDEPIEYTFDEYGGLLDGDDAQKMYDYFQEHFLWTYGYPSEPFFATTGITASETSLTISIGSEAQAAVEFQPDYATNKNIVWASSDESVATVVDGAVFGVSAGSAVMTATTVDGFFAEIQVEVVEPKEYSIYIDLGGTISGFFLGTDADYGEGSWETVTAATAREALTLACEQKFGEGSLVLTKGTYGWSITSVNGMPGNGGSLKSEQSTGWDDVYFYPVQFVKEDGVWGQASVTIPNYTGESTTFALTFQPITFDEVVHTFADEGDQAVYEALMDVYGWPGWGTFSEPFVSLAGVAFAEESATVILEETYTPAIDFSPEDATNKNGSWISSDESVATVDENGVITAVGLGTATITFTTDYGFYTDSIVITVPEPKEYSIYIDLGGKMTSWIVDYYDIESEDDLVDYGGPSWETVSAYSVKEALTLACEQKFGAGSIEFTTSGGIKTINGIDGNGTYLFPDQAMSSENEHWIFYYPIQFVQTDDGWSDMQVYIGAYDGDATTFAVVCQPASFEDEPIEYTFDEYGGLLDGDDAQKMYDYFQEHFLWTYGWPSEPFFATTGITASETSVTIGVGSEAQVAVEIQPDYATNTNVVWASSDESVATVADGKIVGVGIGSAVVTATTIDGFSAEIQVEVVEPKEYSIYIDLGGTISGFFLGTDADYGEGSWETVTAATAREALTLACEQKFGEGSLVLTKGTYGWSITSVNGMPGNGGSLKSEQSTGWDDVYFYPVQFVKEDGVWGQASVTIPNYTGESTTFALTFQPITFDEVVHTFADEGDQAVYEALMDVYGWPGWGTFSEPFVSLAGVAFAEESATVILEETYTPAIDFSPEDATNKNGSWISSDESVATVDENGVITAVGLGTATITFTTDYGFYEASATVEVVDSYIADVFVVDGIEYTLTSEQDLTVEVTGYTEDIASTIVIEPEVTYANVTYTVTSVASKAFAHTYMLSSVTVGVNVGEYAFYRSNVSVLRFSEGVTDIAKSAFSDCYKLRYIVFPSTLGTIGANAFHGCSFYAGDEALEPTVENLAGCKFTGPRSHLEMYIPAVGGVFSVDGVKYKILSNSGEDFTVSVRGFSVESESLTIPESVGYLGLEWSVVSVYSKAFYGCQTLVSVDLGSVSEVGFKAFANCTSLESIIIGETAIGEYAFAGCSSLDVLDLLAVVDIGASAFSQCSGLTFVSFSDDLASVGKNAFFRTLFYDGETSVPRTADNLAGKSFEGADGKLYLI